MATPRADPAASDPEVDGFLALLAARRAPKTVDAYRRDLRALGDWLGGPPSQSASARRSRRYASTVFGARLAASSARKPSTSGSEAIGPFPFASQGRTPAFGD